MVRRGTADVPHGAEAPGRHTGATDSACRWGDAFLDLAFPPELPLNLEPAMTLKRLIALLAALFASLLAAPSAWCQLELKSEDSWARKIMHYDDSNENLEGITVAKKNPVEDTLEELTYNQHEILVTRRMFQMDSKGRIRNGLIFDGKNNLLGRTEYGFDKWDRIQQERLYTKKGKLVRALLYRYDSGGSPVKPVAYTFDPSNPSSKKMVTTDVEPILPASRNENDYPGIRINTTETGNRAPTNNPFTGIDVGGRGAGGAGGAGAPLLDAPGAGVGAAGNAKPKKKSWIRRLFGGSDD